MRLIADETLREQCPTWSAQFDELVDLEGDGSWCGRFSGWLTIRVDRDRLLVDGTVDGWVPRGCDYCLGRFLEPVAVDVREVCLLGSTGAHGGEAWFDEDHEAWRVTPDGWVNVTEMVRQGALLALPTRALCAEGCAGRALLAPPAGSVSDPRLAVLQSLRLEVEDHGGPEETDE